MPLANASPPAVTAGPLRLTARYSEVVPQQVRRGVSNFFSNFADAWSAINNMLQGKFELGFEDATRVGANTLFGLFGILDPASEMGLDHHYEDFGQTLGRYGVGAGEYYHVVRGEVTGTDPGDRVEVWFEGGRKSSQHFTYTARAETGAKVSARRTTRDSSGRRFLKTPAVMGSVVVRCNRAVCVIGRVLERMSSMAPEHTPHPPRPGIVSRQLAKAETPGPEPCTSSTTGPEPERW